MNVNLNANAQGVTRANAFSIIAWTSKTMTYAVIGPWVLVGVACFVTMMLGASANDVRFNVVSVATLDPEAWPAAARFLKGFWLFLGALIVVYRVITSATMFRVADQIADRVEVTVSALVSRVVRDCPSLADRRVQRLAAMGFAAAVIGALFAALAHEPAPRNAPSLAARFAPQDGVAIQLKDGTIRSGQAEVSKRQDGAYVVKFKN
jgi:hypothetical protein